MLPLRPVAATIVLCACLLSACAGSSPAEVARLAADRHAEGIALQRWAAGYDPSDNLFEDTVAIDSDNSTFTFTATGAWDALSDDEQHAVVTNAENAVKDAWCIQADHRGDFIPGLAIEIIDDSGNTLGGTVTGSGLTCGAI